MPMRLGSDAPELRFYDAGICDCLLYCARYTASFEIPTVSWMMAERVLEFLQVEVVAASLPTALLYTLGLPPVP
jgi:hypothetical protein